MTSPIVGLATIPNGVACVTGQGPQGSPHTTHQWCREQAHTNMESLAAHHGVTTIGSGMAAGWDIWAAQAALNLGLALHAHIPYPQQAGLWAAPDRREWRRLVAAATHTTTYRPSTSTGGFGSPEASRLRSERDDGLVSAADAMVALIDLGARRQRSGPTATMVRRAAYRGIPVIHVDPTTRVVRVIPVGTDPRSL
jgi:hypothetical protein